MPIFQADLEQLEREAEAVTTRGAPGSPPSFSRRTSPDASPPYFAATPHHHHHHQQQQQHRFSPFARKLSEESLRTELCEGPVPDSPKPTTPEVTDSLEDAQTSDRVELIERLKKGESPTWIPNRHLESLFNDHPQPPLPQSPRTSPSNRSNLSPPANIIPEKPTSTGPRHEDDPERLHDGLNIQRPRSALHSGDFTENQARRQERERHQARDEQDDDEGVGRRGPVPSRQQSGPWIATSPPRDFTPFQYDRSAPYTPERHGDRFTPSSLSSSYSSSFAYKPPTSPLVQSESNEELDLVMPMSDAGIASTPLSARRHTLNLNSSPSPFAFPSRPASIGGTSSLRREGSLPYQAHQPRRSMSSAQNAHTPGASPHTPSFLRSRRPSFGSDSSPLQHASMVGSYEESILRGRMSTTPSKPLDFLAQIGVLGFGKCKPNLKCPPHVTLPFPAVFYSYGSSSSHGRKPSEDGPSPYVGQIDLENGLPNHGEDERSKRKMSSRHVAGTKVAENGFAAEGVSGSPTADGGTPLAGRPRRRRSGSPRAPPGGSYRIPEKGQIQIVIKNPNKTAVKLFLVPYDLAGMEPGTKTFIRQRSYSAGPIIENAANGGHHLSSKDPGERPTLRYLAHLHICSPSRGRYYLYKSIRIVFANRVPDGKERLRNETTFPEPRFSAYKPIRAMNPPSSGPGAMLAAEKAFRRRSSGFTFGHGAAARTFDATDDAVWGSPGGGNQAHADHQHESWLAHSPLHFGGGRGTAGDYGQPVDPIPLRLPSRARLDSDVSDSTATTAATGAGVGLGLGFRSPGTDSLGSRPATKDGHGGQDPRYEKLSKGDVGYGGNVFAVPGARSGAGSGATSPGPGEGLLSQRLRSLGAVRGHDSWTTPPAPGEP